MLIVQDCLHLLSADSKLAAHGSAYIQSPRAANPPSNKRECQLFFHSRNAICLDLRVFHHAKAKEKRLVECMHLHRLDDLPKLASAQIKDKACEQRAVCPYPFYVCHHSFLSFLQLVAQAGDRPAYKAVIYGGKYSFSCQVTAAISLLDLLAQAQTFIEVRCCWIRRKAKLLTHLCKQRLIVLQSSASLAHTRIAAHEFPMRGLMVAIMAEEMEKGASGLCIML